MAVISGKENKYEKSFYKDETKFSDAVNSAASKITTESTIYSPKGLKETQEFYIGPTLGIGATYALIPGRFKINAGVQLNPFSWHYESSKYSPNGDGDRYTSTTKNGDGVIISKTDVTAFNPLRPVSSLVNREWGAFTGYAAGGFVFNFFENITLDFMVNSGWFSSDWTLDLTTVNVMFTFKF